MTSSKSVPSPRRSAVTVIAAIILVASEVLAAAIAGAWAIAGLLKLGDILFWGLQLVMVGGAMMAIIAFARQAMRVEPVFGSRKR
ncbi:hypothetical protein [Candidatus Raskinella chloraquaticus]